LTGKSMHGINVTMKSNVYIKTNVGKGGDSLKAVLSTKEAYQYVGNQMIWEELLVHHGDNLIPFRTLKRGDRHWLVKEIDHVLILAQAAGTLRAA